MRLVLGALVAKRLGALPLTPGSPSPGRPADPSVTLALVLERLALPCLRTPREALLARTGPLAPARLPGALRAAKRALGLSEWASPRLPLLGVMARAGEARAARLLRPAPPGMKNLPLSRHLQVLRSTRARAEKSGSLDARTVPLGEFGLMRVGVLHSVAGGELAERLVPGLARVWVTAEGALAPPGSLLTASGVGSDEVGTDASAHAARHLPTRRPQDHP